MYGISLQGLHRSFLQHDGLLSQSLEFGNAVWAPNEEELKPTFTNLSQSVYYTDVRKLEGTDTINDWVNSKTNGKIKKLFGKCGRDGILNFFCEKVTAIR